MALVVADRVKQTAATISGTGTYTLSGTFTGFQTFTDGVGDGNTTYYAAVQDANFEIGIGTYTASGTTLARTTILQSSNSDNAVNWSSATPTIFTTYPADKAVFKDASNNINGTFVGNLTGTLHTAAQLNMTSVGTLSSLTTSGDISVGDDLTVNGGQIDLRSDSGAVAKMKFYCEVSNAHAQTLQAQPHSAGSSAVLVLPTASGTLVGTGDSGSVSNTMLAGSIANSKLANSSITVSDGSNTTAVALGGTVTFAGTSNEVEVAESSGTITIGLPSAITANVTGNLTGNASGTAATVTGAAQTNITSLGTLTALTVDNVAINGTTIGHTDDTDLITLADGAVTVAGDVTLSSTDSGSGDAPTLTLKRDSSSPANFDNQGNIKFLGENSASEEIKYGQIQVQASNPSDGSEESRMVFSIMNNGVDKEVAFFDGYIGDGALYLRDHIDIIFEGATANTNETTLTVADPTADRTVTLPDATGTVITTGNTSDITTVGTLTTLTVDNVIINGSTIGHTGDTDLMTVASGVLTVAGEVDATSLDISGDADIDGTLEADAITVNGTALNTVIADEATALAIALG
jgi:hypothetical protein